MSKRHCPHVGHLMSDVFISALELDFSHPLATESIQQHGKNLNSLASIANLVWRKNVHQGKMG
jgi:hypothetical protein